MRLRNEETGEETTRETEVVIGCDGSASAIRAEMLKLSRFNFSQQYLDYGYKELDDSGWAQAANIFLRLTRCTSGRGATTC